MQHLIGEVLPNTSHPLPRLQSFGRKTERAMVRLACVSLKQRGVSDGDCGSSVPSAEELRMEAADQSQWPL